MIEEVEEAYLYYKIHIYKFTITNYLIRRYIILLSSHKLLWDMRKHISKAYPSIFIEDRDIIVYLNFLEDNKKLKDFLVALYFKVDHLPLEFDLSAFPKIRILH